MAIDPNIEAGLYASSNKLQAIAWMYNGGKCIDGAVKGTILTPAQIATAAGLDATNTNTICFRTPRHHD